MFVPRCLARGLSSFSTHVSVRNAGHSKWANIRHIKGEKDLEKSKLITFTLQRIRTAIQEGGSANPDHNIHLAQIIEVAKKKNVPIATIQSCLKNAQADKSNPKILWFEIRGPRNCFLIAQALCEHPKKSKDMMSSIIRRNGVQWADNVGKSMFEQKGIIVATVPEGSTGDPMEKAVDDAIECGAEEVEPTDQTGELVFFCSLQDMNIVRTKLESKNYKVISAEFEFIPKMTVALNDQETEVMAKLMNKIDEHPDVVKVYTNIE
ncbi:DUF28 [Nesidiocoris tenuis]|uniref:DUF28 n=1 Tax=Nesidiocoris tenuis TaxID=355587 RepID=A0ABN7ASX0_9HEMI|nr:DUF28 [Nesidiocoris tenuis]